MENKVLVDISTIIAKYYGLTFEQICNKTRKKYIVRARQISHYFACKKTKYNLEEIGNVIGNKDHATVMHSRKTVINDMMNIIYKEDIKKLNESIDNYFTCFSLDSLTSSCL